MASFLALVGIAMTTYLILFLAQPPDAAFASITIGKKGEDHERLGKALRR